MTTEERRKRQEAINDALKVSNGNRAAAAALLKMTPRELGDIIHDVPKLRARWAYGGHNATRFPQPEETINRDLITRSNAVPEEPQLTDTDKKLLDSAASEDAKLRQGLRNLQLSEREVDIAIACQEMGGGFYRQSLKLFAGGASRSAIVTQSVCDEIRKRLSEVRTKLELPADHIYTEDRKAWVTEEKILTSALAEMLQESRNLAEIGLRTAQLQAEIENRKIWKMKRAMAKPGFSNNEDIQEAH
jgi:hypothetical protein